MKQVAPFVWVVPGVLLLLALAPLPYGYYTFLRIVVTAATAFLAYKQFEADGGVGPWTVVLAATALLFNPLIPIHLGREFWTFVDPAVAILFGAHFLAVRRVKSE